MRKSRIKRLFPQVIQRTAHPGSPLDALLEVMEDLHAPAEDVLHRLPQLLDPYFTPESFLPYLGTWVALEPVYTPHAAPGAIPISTGVGSLRELVACAAELARWRGTGRGLLLFLRAATGADGFRIDETVTDPRTGRTRPFHIRVTAPASLQAHQALLDRIIRYEKPAYVTYELVFNPSSPSPVGT